MLMVCGAEVAAVSVSVSVAVTVSEMLWVDSPLWSVRPASWPVVRVMLPPVPAVWGEDRRTTWHDEWLRRIETSEPWVLTWLRENRHGPYWDHGSVRLAGTTAGYERIQVPTLIAHRTGDSLVPVEMGRYLAQNIPGAKYVELPGNDHMLQALDQACVCRVESHQ